MTTPLVLLGLAILAGAFVWLLSVRQPGSSLRPSASDPDSGFGTGSAPSSAVEEPEPEPIGVMELGAPDPAPAGAAPAVEAPTLIGQGMDSFAFVPVSASDDLDLKTRLLGVLGLISLILVTSAVVAVGIWMLGRGIRLELAHLSGN